jgi:vacuolar-type H+-ATPase subunit H
MLDISRFLQRFTGVPGRPARPGIPVDHRAALEAELAPLLSGLERTQRDTEEIAARAKAEADQIDATANEQRRSVVADARARVADEQSRIAAARIAEVQDERRAILEASKTEAERIDRVVRDRIPAAIVDLVARVVEGKPA